LRNRFFIIILTTLVFAAVGINLVHVYFFQSQRLKLIDKQIGESSESLLSSREFIEATDKLDTVEDTISKVLQGTRIGKVFILRDANAKILYQSFNVSLLKTELPIHPEWVAVKTEEEYVRVRNIELPGPRHLTLQVGLVLDKNFLNWEILDSHVINYIIGIVVALFFASVLLTLVLLSPLRLLIRHLKEITSNLGNLRDLKPLPRKLLKFGRAFWASADEFSSLVSTTQKLIDRINRNHKLTRSWTLQMAHELKTPLAILRAEVESKKKMGLLPEPYTQEAFKEIHHMSEIITQFLDWADLENSEVQKNLHALRMKALLKSLVSRLDKIAPERIRIQVGADFSVFANPIHLDLMIMNILTNALKFSPAAKTVDIIVEDHVLVIRDYGMGISKEVVERLGQPFNVGIHEEEGVTGNGLGLAWVTTVAKIYEWKLAIQSSFDGTEVRVEFPREEA
jgi:signal transduction histidine kinase